MRRAPLVLLALLLAAAAAAGDGGPALGPVDGHGFTSTDLGRVEVGFPAPDFTLEDESGRRWTLSDLRGEKAVVLVFYRGHW